MHREDNLRFAPNATGFFYLFAQFIANSLGYGYFLHSHALPAFYSRVDFKIAFAERDLKTMALIVFVFTCNPFIGIVV